MRWFFLFTVAVLLYSCSSHPLGPRPKDVLRSDKLIDLLVDIHYLDGIYSVLGEAPELLATPDEPAPDFYGEIFERHNTDEETLRRSMQYYYHNPAQFEFIYINVVERLNRMKAEAELAAEEELY